MMRDRNFFQDFLKDELGILQRDNLFRQLRPIESAQDSNVILESKSYLNLSSNNYLGLANSVPLKEKSLGAIKSFGCSSGASRLISGDNKLYHKLEELTAHFKLTQSALVFNSGYMANVGTIAGIVGRSDVIFSDRLNHASIIDGCLLSQAKLFRYAHKDMKALESLIEKNCNRYKKKLIVTDTVFSMDGDVAPLGDIVNIAKKFNAIIMTDEAHATGIFGKNGRGMAEELGLEDKIDIQMGTFSKAVGGLGGFVAGSKELTEYLINKARPFIYTTSLPPAVVASNIAGIELIKESQVLRRNLQKNIEFFKNSLKGCGFDTMQSSTQIIPILTKENDITMEFSRRLFEEGVLAQGIRPPTVPKGLSRLRVSIMATHTKGELKQALDLMRQIGKELNII